jgi:hypothetical protein
MAFALATYNSLERIDQSRAVTKFKSSAQITREVDNFKTQLANIRTPEDLFKNRRVMSFVLSAYGLDSEINFMGRIKAVLNSDITDPNSTVNRLQDRRFREMAADLLVQGTGVANLKLPTVTNRVVDRFISAEYEKSLGQRDPAIREARYFAANIGKVKSVFEILGDPVLRSVVTDTLGLPKQLALQPVETQAETIRRRLDIAQFRTTGTSSSTSQQARTNALADVASLTKASAVASAAGARVDEIGTRLRTLLSGYDNLAALQDPAGVNAAEIPIHDAAIPELVRQRGLTAAAEASVGRLADSLNRMGQLRNLASDPANAANLAAYKAEFASLATGIQDEVTTGAAYRFDGSDQNLLNGSLPATLSTTIDSAGRTVSLRSHDLTGFLGAVSTAATAFAAVTDASDTANLGAVTGAISSGGPQLGAVRDALIEDRAAATLAIGRVSSFTSTMDTAALATGRASVADADSRAQQIAAKLAELRDVANTSAGLGAGDDRSALSAQATTLIGEINTLLSTAGAGADDLLGATDRDYALTGGRNITLRAVDLAGKIGTPLAGAGVGDASAALSLMAQIDATLLPDLVRARERLQTDRRALDEAATVFDPRGKIDEGVRRLGAELAGIVQRAATDGANLLVAGQPGFLVQFKSVSGSLTIAAQGGFQAGIQAKLDAAAAQLPGNLGGAGGAYEALQSAMTIVDDAAVALRAGRRSADAALFEARRRVAQSPAGTDAAEANKPTEFTKRFIQRFLVMRDVQSANEANGTGTGARAILGLFA